MKKLLLLSAAIVAVHTLTAQVIFDPDTVSIEPFDYGKMWTFDNAPVDYFAKTYDFNPDAEWMEKVRLSALRLSSGCSAGFVSPNGLIITNHHCARTDAVLSFPPEQNVLRDGFLAPSRAEEHKLKNFHADQLLRIEDITTLVKDRMQGGSSQEAVLKTIEREYSVREGWQGLILQTLSFYSGGKFSLYGYKRYTDVRLVFLPENELGFFGGDPDNFTYPRYALDCSFLRAYDEQGNPLNSSDFFYPFNPNGIREGEPVFVIGNPGSTGRYRTMAQLQYDRSRHLPVMLEYFRDRMAVLQKLNSSLQSDSLENVIFSLSNAEKAYGGRLEGLYNEYFMTRKEMLEEASRSQFLSKEGADYWRQVAEKMEEMKTYTAESILLSPHPFQGKVVQLLHKLDALGKALSGKDMATESKIRTEVQTILNQMHREAEQQIFADILAQLLRQSQMPEGLKNYLGKQSPAEKSAELFQKSSVLTKGELPATATAFEKSRDPLLIAARALVPQYLTASNAMSKLNAEVRELEQKIINANFTITGTQSPPDATFSLRISDGLVKGYRYNGTIAPFHTSFYGMYDRYTVHSGRAPWSLPARWLSPPAELLKAPLNFVATFDTIGGNSGSPVINRNREIVGLNFDSNVERLPIRSILYDPDYGRSVGVHMGGVAAALKYIYQADWLLQELGVSQ